MLLAVTCFPAEPQVFLKIPPFARATGLAESYAANSTGTYGLFYNPAGMHIILGSELQLSWIPWLQAGQHFNLAYVSGLKLPLSGKFGASLAWTGLSRNNTDIIPVNWGLYPVSVNNISNIHAVLGAGFQIIPMFYAGLNLKMIYASMDDGSGALNYGLDFGLMGEFDMLGQLIKVGAVVSNYGYELFTVQREFDTPRKFSAGISDKFEFLSGSLMITAEAVFSSSMNALFKIGFEYSPFDFLSLRMGYKAAATNQPVFGAGYKMQDAELNYTFESYEGLGSTHAVSLLYSWGTPPVSLSAGPALISPNGDGKLETVTLLTVIGEVEKANKARLNIYNAKGVKEAVVLLPVKDRGTAIWNGRINGAPAADGLHYLELEVEYDGNRKALSKQSVIAVDNTPPRVSLAREYRKAGLYGKPLILLPQAYDAGKISRWEIRISDGKSDFYGAAGRGLPPAVFEWAGKGMSGRDLTEGKNYYFRMKVYDHAGNAAETRPGEYMFSPAKKAIVLTFYSDALFYEGKAAVKISAYKMLKKIRKEIRKYPGADFVIFGHTDSTEEPGGYKTRLELSRARAKAVEYYMKNLLSIKKGYFLTQGYGDDYPLSLDDTSAGRAMNRRVEVILTTKIYGGGKKR